MLDWNKYMGIAETFQYKVRWQDREDVKQEIILSLAIAECRQPDRDEPLSTKTMFRIAKYECQKYWRRVRRTEERLISMSTALNDDGNGHVRELGETIRDDSGSDMDSRLSARLELANYPQRLLAIGNKMLQGTALLNEEHQYLWRFRRKKARNQAQVA